MYRGGSSVVGKKFLRKFASQSLLLGENNNSEKKTLTLWEVYVILLIMTITLLKKFTSSPCFCLGEDL